MAVVWFCFFCFCFLHGSIAHFYPMPVGRLLFFAAISCTVHEIFSSPFASTFFSPSGPSHWAYSANPKKMDDEKFVHGFIVRSSTDAPKRFWFFSQMMSVAIPKWGLMSYLDELISLRVCRSRDWRTWNQKFWTWLVLWLLSREISETCRFWFASGIVCTWNQVSPSVFSLKECESNSLREISAQLRLTGLLFCVVSSRNYTVWSRGSWLGGALVSA